LAVTRGCLERLSQGSCACGRANGLAGSGGLEIRPSRERTTRLDLGNGARTANCTGRCGTRLILENTDCVTARTGQDNTAVEVQPHEAILRCGKISGGEDRFQNTCTFNCHDCESPC